MGAPTVIWLVTIVFDGGASRSWWFGSWVVGGVSGWRASGRVVVLCVLLGFPQGLLSAVIFSSQFFKRREHGFEASVLTLVLNHAQFVIT